MALKHLSLHLFTTVAIANQLTKFNARDVAVTAHSDPFYPSPWMDPEADGWKDAYVKAKDFVSKMTLLEKVNLTTGVG